MPRSTSCVYNGQEISVDEALRIKSAAGAGNTPDLRCTECGNEVGPHQAGGSHEAHMEHWVRNPNCSLSDPER